MGRGRLLDWRSGGWLLTLAILCVLAVVVWRIVPILGTSSRAIGDGRTIESYRFDLSDLTVPRELVVSAGFPKDGITALVEPQIMLGEDVEAFNAARRGKYLVPDDRVVGLVVGDTARAYPVRVLNWHEVINDTIEGVRVAVTYHPLCDSAVVFRRTLGGATFEFGVSGLLFNSNLLLYDRRPDGAAESLWSQLLGRAVSGPAARQGRTLEILPASLARWDAWLDAHPETTVLAPDPDLVKRYERNPYGNYYLTGEPRFPVAPLVPAGERMQRLVAVRGGAGWAVCPLEAGATRDSGCARARRLGAMIDLSGDPPSVVWAGEEPAAVVYALRFAWHAHRAAAGQGAGSVSREAPAAADQ